MMKLVKYAFGGIFTLLILGICLYFSFDLWGITLFSKEILCKILITMGILFVGFLLLLIFGSFFFKNHSENYKTPENGVAGRKETNINR